MGLTALGGGALVLALVAAGATAVASCRRGGVDWGRRGLVATFALVTVALVALAWALVGQDYSLVYVADHASRDTTWPYRLAGLWGGMAGSLLLWTWMLAGWAVVASRSVRRRLPDLAGGTQAVLAVEAAVFLGLLVTVSRPFATLAVPATDGGGLTPILRHPAMLYHPPLLYSGYVGLAVPAAMAVAALVRGTAGDWLAVARRYMVASLVLLAVGMTAGAHWAYVELGWGGYWAWDPVENGALLPWLAGVAFLHSALVARRHSAPSERPESPPGGTSRAIRSATSRGRPAREAPGERADHAPRRESSASRFNRAANPPSAAAADAPRRESSATRSDRAANPPSAAAAAAGGPRRESSATRSDRAADGSAAAAADAPRRESSATRSDRAANPPAAAAAAAAAADAPRRESSAIRSDRAANRPAAAAADGPRRESSATRSDRAADGRATHGLAFLAFGLSLLGAFLTRSGTTASVHAFAEARAVGRVLLAALAVTAVALVALTVRRPRPRPASAPVRALTQAGAVRANNTLLLAVIVVVGFGLLYPVLTGNDLVVTGRYFAIVTAPLAVGILAAIGVGPRLGWHPRPWPEVRRRLRPAPGGAAAALALASIILDDRRPLSLGMLALAGAAAALTVAEWRGRSPSRTANAGGLLAHLGVVVLLAGVAGTATGTHRTASLVPGQTITVRDYTLRLDDLVPVDAPDGGRAARADLDVSRRGSHLATLRPVALIAASGDRVSEAALRSTPREDLQVALRTVSGGGGAVVVEVFVVPLAQWVWWGALLVAVGIAVAARPRQDSPMTAVEQ